MDGRRLAPGVAPRDALGARQDIAGPRLFVRPVTMNACVRVRLRPARVMDVIRLRPAFRNASAPCRFECVRIETAGFDVACGVSGEPTATSREFCRALL